MRKQSTLIMMLAIILAFAFQVSGQSEVVTNDDVIKMVEAKLTDALIVGKIKASTCKCDTSVDSLLKLKSAGVSDAVIEAMVAASGAAKSDVTAAPPSGTGSLGDANPLVSVRVFKASVDFPYDFDQLQIQTIVELKKRGVPAGNAEGTYALEGEVIEWKAGNRATRMLVGMGAGRESAKIRFWLVDQKGTKIYDRTDTIRQSFWGGGAAPSAGQLVQPFAIKIAERVAESGPVRQR